jgi:hypothetical protein
MGVFLYLLIIKHYKIFTTIMKKITKNILFLSVLALMTFTVKAQEKTITYYEDFRYEGTARGFSIQKVNIGSQEDGNVGKRVGDVVDADDSNSVFNTSDRPENRIPSGVSRYDSNQALTQRAISFKNISGDEGSVVNHELEAWALMTSQDLSSALEPSVTFWTKKRDVIGGGATLSVFVSEDYTHDALPSTATWTEETTNIVGEIATSDISPLTYVKGHLDLSAYTGSSVTLAFKVVTDATPYEQEVSNHGVFYISDVYFEVSKEVVADGEFSAFNTSSSGQVEVFNTPSAAIDVANFTNTGAWNNIFSTENAAPRLAQSLIPVGEGYKFEVSNVYNPIAVSKITYKLANAASNKGTNGLSSQWIVQGSNNDVVWDDLCDPIVMSSANTNTEVTVDLNTTQAYRYYQFVLVYAWEPNSAYTQLQQIDFVVDSSIVVEKEDIEPGEITDGNASDTGQLNIFKEPTAAMTNDNFSQITAWSNLFVDTADADPRFVQSLIPAGEGYMFEVASNYNPIVVSKIYFDIANGTSNKGVNENDEAIGSSWVLQASNDTANWDDVSEATRIFSSNSSGELVLNTTTAYRYYRMVLSEAWKPSSIYTSLRQLKFTVADAALSVADSMYKSITVFPNPTNNLLHINTTNANSINSVQLFDVKGKLIYTAFDSNSIDVKSYKSGLYILKISFEDGVITTKKVVVN